jgi:sulfate adenylyltransferase large subunit
MEALRIATAGSVDDGKSTLIGRLLHDTKTIMEDQLASVAKASNRYGDGTLNLALLTDGLRAEREQGITIDVAYRYFATPKRRFVLADSPGHVQYTRNMVTAASSADVAIVLIDATKGVIEQTRRHTYICTMLRVKHLVVAVNKMDLVQWQQSTFETIVESLRDYLALVPGGSHVPVTFIPVSALDGDNIVTASTHTPWFDGPVLLDFLEAFVAPPAISVGARLDVQWTLRDYSSDYRGLAGQLSGSSLQVGDNVTVLPSMQTSTVVRIDRAGEQIDTAQPGQAISVVLSEPLDVSRGDIIVSGPTPSARSEITLDVCWMTEAPLSEGSRLWWKHATQTGKAVVTQLVHRVDLDSAAQCDTATLELNDIGRITLTLSSPIHAVSFAQNQQSGRLILVDERTNTTAGAALLV